MKFVLRIFFLFVFMRLRRMLNQLCLRHLVTITQFYTNITFMAVEITV